MTQGIRPSQFVTMYGPGAILEGKNGPRIILEAGLGLFTHKSGRRPDRCRIDDMRMSNGLLDGNHIYRLPTNAEEGRREDEYVYRTNAFPRWRICHRQHGNNGSLIYSQKFCPVCRDGGGRNAVGFVMACRNGHLDDLPWDRLVHDSSGCKGAGGAGARRGLGGKSVFWKRAGATLGSVRLECPHCGKRRGFGTIYYNEHFPCRGRHPQNELRDGDMSTEECGQKAKVMIRQAANLRLPETRTLLSIRSTYTELHQSLQDHSVKIALVGWKEGSKDELIRTLDSLIAAKLIRPASVDALRRADRQEILQAVKDLEMHTPDTYHGLIMDEFDALLDASKSGAPPSEAPRPKSGSLFELSKEDVVSVAAPGGRQITVAPIRTLRTVTVQTGFRRDVPSAGGDASLPKLVPSMYSPADDDKGWYPGVELYGEGIFVRFKDNDGWAPNPTGEHAKRWLDALGKAESYPDFAFRDAARSRNELHPGFVWWHTLSHLLVRSMGEEAGYASPAIRERIYLKSKDGECNGGILLYATQPGSDGTLGGLIALVPHMEKMLHSALESAATCSGDPLCIDSELGPGGYNGASCYACSMNSETSCEHRNMWLDRGVLLDNLP